MRLDLLLVIIIIVALVLSPPWYPYNRNWGYRPVGVVTLLLIILIVAMLARGIP